MSFISSKHPFLPVFAIVAVSSTVLRGAEPITDKDAEELKALLTAFMTDLSSGKMSAYPKYFDKASLVKLMDEYRRWISWMVDLHPDDIEKVLTLKPDAPSVRKEQDPVKFFAGIEMTPQMLRMVKSFGQDLQVVGVTGTREKAYLVMEGKMDGAAGTSKPHLSAWLAIATPEGWRLDSASMVRSLRSNVEKMKGTAATR